MRNDRKPVGLLLGIAVALTGLVACTEVKPPTSGKCCLYTGPTVYDCASIETLGPGADLDGRCNQVNQGNSCAWNYANPECCEIAIADGFGDVTSCDPEGSSGECCVYTGPVAHDCMAIENLGPGADLDGRCNQVNQGQSCSWLYGTEGCCEKAVADGFPGNVQCP
jgi:hypothetical protein